MTEEAPKIIVSEKSQAVLVDGYRFQIDIYRADDEADWLLAVVDQQGKSYVWDDTFASDSDALRAASDALLAQGAVGFTGGGEVLPFRVK